ncbi:MATE family efflux transporter [Dialister sp.]|uniref:MATE family efflux transporter n=1 Tax=Dialister sp. TaxID=1955814 RepID=UPI003EFD4AC6
MRTIDFTSGSIFRKILLFSLPLMVGNVFQQLYNVVDTLVVGKFLGEAPLAAVGSAYTLMIFLTSILIGLSMGSSVYFSLCFGRKNFDRMRQSIYISFLSIGALTLVMNGAVYFLLDSLIRFMQVPSEVVPYIREYLWWIFSGLLAVFLYNFGAALLRAVGDSVTPLVFLIISSLLNAALDILFVVYLGWGVAGAAQATVISQYVSGAGIFLYCLLGRQDFHISGKDMTWDRKVFLDMSQLSLLTSLQQSIMNFGILLVQGLVNSFGTTVMAAFAAGVKIDTIAYSPLQDFGNAFSTYVAQNYGAGNRDRIRQGIKTAGKMIFIFSLLASGIVSFLAPLLMGFFVPETAEDVVAVGSRYLRIEGSCYLGIGILFMLYGFYRAVKRAAVSVVLTVLSLGTRVVLAYFLSSFPEIGVTGIWLSIPIGWALADMYGMIKGYRLVR